ncbi:uncharacterized protein LOC110830044 [Zootermopsis nevadensis]|nr:uncharacterized protein LOC110830044 [Zootermopsis nevadensis]
MRLKGADGSVDIPGSLLHTHNVGQRDQNRNQPSTRDTLPDSGIIHCSTQWANSYVASPNTTACTTPGKELQQHLANGGSNFNNNITASFQQHRSTYNSSSEFLSESSPDDSLGDFEDGQQSSSSLDASPQGDEYRCFSHEEVSDSDSLSDDGRCRGLLAALGGRGIVNPNYPGFQYLACELHPSDTDDTEEERDTGNKNCNNNNNGEEDIDDSDNETESKIDSVNHLDSVENFQKDFYDKPKFNIPVDAELDCYCVDGSESVAAVDDEKDLNVRLPESENIVTADSKNVSAEELESDSKVLVTNMAAIALTCNNIDTPLIDSQQINCSKMSDAFLSSAKEDLLCKNTTEEGSVRNKCEDVMSCLNSLEPCSGDANILNMGDSNRAVEEWEEMEKSIEKFNKEEQISNEKEQDDDLVVPRKKEKMEINYSVKKSRSNSCASNMDMLQVASAPVLEQQEQQVDAVVRWRDFGPRGGRDHVLANRRSVPTAACDKKRSSTEILGGFDVYNIETAMPKIDLDAIESHLRAAREEERRRRNDREEIRRRLAMGSDTDEYYGSERPGRKPSLQARLQSVSFTPPGMNLQICFMNETVSDTESPSSDTETASSPAKTDPEKIIAVSRSSALPVKPLQLTPSPAATRPSTSLLTLPIHRETEPPHPMTEADFFARQAQLQAEARMALAQAKEMAHMQMEVERQRLKTSPITEMVRSSLEKVGIPFPEDRRRVSRQILTEMNVAQLQVIVNDLHTQIEILNEGLVKFLMDRDDLHMEQDSMLVDIEDLTRYLGAKEQTVKEQEDLQLLNQNNNNNNHNFLPAKPKVNRVAGLAKK